MPCPLNFFHHDPRTSISHFSTLSSAFSSLASPARFSCSSQQPATRPPFRPRLPSFYLFLHFCSPLCCFLFLLFSLLSFFIHCISPHFANNISRISCLRRCQRPRNILRHLQFLAPEDGKIKNETRNSKPDATKRGRADPRTTHGSEQQIRTTDHGSRRTDREPPTNRARQPLS